MSEPMTYAHKLRHADRLFIGGTWVASGSGRMLEIVSPDTESVVARTAEADEADMHRAVLATQDAFSTGRWPAMAGADRTRMIRALADALRARQPEMTAAWTAQVGAPGYAAPHFCDLSDAAFREAAELAENYAFERVAATNAAPVGIIVHEPVGVVAAIAPWNAPYLLMATKIAPALAAGCTVIMKPSPEAPIEAYIIAECAEQIGLPPGVLNLVPAHRTASEHLVRNPALTR